MFLNKQLLCIIILFINYSANNEKYLKNILNVKSFKSYIYRYCKIRFKYASIEFGEKKKKIYYCKIRFKYSLFEFRRKKNNNTVK